MPAGVSCVRAGKGGADRCEVVSHYPRRPPLTLGGGATEVPWGCPWGLQPLLPHSFLTPSFCILFCAGEVQAFYEDLSGRQYVNEVFNFSVDKLYDLLFTDSPFQRDFMEQRRFSGQFLSGTLCPLLPQATQRPGPPFPPPHPPQGPARYIFPSAAALCSPTVAMKAHWGARPPWAHGFTKNSREPLLLGTPGVPSTWHPSCVTLGSAPAQALQSPGYR